MLILSRQKYARVIPGHKKLRIKLGIINLNLKAVKYPLPDQY